jgi:hypothetical protein
MKPSVCARTSSAEDQVVRVPIAPTTMLRPNRRLTGHGYPNPATCSRRSSREKMRRLRHRGLLPRFRLFRPLHRLDPPIRLWSPPQPALAQWFRRLRRLRPRCLQPQLRARRERLRLRQRLLWLRAHPHRRLRRPPQLCRLQSFLTGAPQALRRFVLALPASVPRMR